MIVNSKSAEPLILTVNSNHRNLELLNQFLNRDGYQVVSAINWKEFNHVINQDAQINLALIDITGFDRSIWQWCEELRNEQIPFFIILPRQSPEIQHQSLINGASHVLIKPLVSKQLFGLIESLIGDER